MRFEDRRRFEAEVPAGTPGIELPPGAEIGGEVDAGKTPVWFDPEQWTPPSGVLLVGEFEGEDEAALFYRLELSGTAGTAVEFLDPTLQRIPTALRRWRFRLDAEE